MSVYSSPRFCRFSTLLGVVAMLLLSVLGASDDMIVYDYTLTEQAGEAFQAFNYE